MRYHIYSQSYEIFFQLQSPASEKCSSKEPRCPGIRPAGRKLPTDRLPDIARMRLCAKRESLASAQSPVHSGVPWKGFGDGVLCTTPSKRMSLRHSVAQNSFVPVRQSGFCQNALEATAGKVRAHPLPHNDGVGFPKQPPSRLQTMHRKSCAIRESLAFCATFHRSLLESVSYSSSFERNSARVWAALPRYRLTPSFLV